MPSACSSGLGPSGSAAQLAARRSSSMTSLIPRPLLTQLITPALDALTFWRNSTSWSSLTLSDQVVHTTMWESGLRVTSSSARPIGSRTSVRMMSSTIRSGFVRCTSSRASPRVCATPTQIMSSRPSRRSCMCSQTSRSSSTIATVVMSPASADRSRAGRSQPHYSVSGIGGGCAILRKNSQIAATWSWKSRNSGALATNALACPDSAAHTSSRAVERERITTGVAARAGSWRTARSTDAPPPEIFQSSSTSAGRGESSRLSREIASYERAATSNGMSSSCKVFEMYSVSIWSSSTTSTDLECSLDISCPVIWDSEFERRSRLRTRLGPYSSPMPLLHDSTAEMQANSVPGLVCPDILSPNVRLEDCAELAWRDPAAVVLDRELPGAVDPAGRDVHRDWSSDPAVLAGVLQQVLEQEPEQHLVGDHLGQRVGRDRCHRDELVDLGQHPVRLVERLLRGHLLARRRLALGQAGRDLQALGPALHPARLRDDPLEQ